MAQSPQGNRAQATQAHRHIAIGTPLGEDVLLLRSFSYTEQLGRPFEISLDTLSSNSEINFDDIVGRNVTVRLQLPGGGERQNGGGQGTSGGQQDEPRYFNGIVIRFVQVGASGRLTQYQATAVPWLWLLTRTSDCRIFQDKAVPDIIKEVFREYGFTDFEDRLSGTYPTWKYCVQYRETDFNFVSRLMEQEGMYYFFEHENGKHTLILADSPSAHQPFAGYEEIPFRPPDAQFREREYVYSLTCSQQVQPGVYAHTDFDFEVPNKSLLAKSQIARNHALPNFEIYDFPGEYVEHGDGETYARRRIEEIQSRFELYDGSADARGVAAGCKFTLTDHPRGDFNKDYLVIAANVQASTDEYDSAGGGGGGGTFDCSFTALDHSAQFRPARVTPNPMIRGPQTAIVVGPSGEEIHTDEYGRVKVQFHWDRYSQADENSSCWIRVAQVWAGKKWGGMFIPRIGQEVIVEFLEGDPDQPIITGRVYNGGTMPPYDLPANATMSTVKSNSSKGGGGFNELRFEDKKGSEQLFIHAERRQDNRVKADSYEYVGNDRHLIVKNKQYELVEEDKHQHTKGDHNEKVEGTTSHESGQDFQQRVGVKHALEAGQEIHLKAGMKAILEAGTQLTLKVGSNFVDLSPAGVTIQGTLVQINSGGAPGTGSGCSLIAPEDAKEAATAEPGEVSSAQGRGAQRGPTQLGSATVRTLEEGEPAPLEFQLLDASGQPVANERYRIRTLDGNVREGQTDAQGVVRLEQQERDGAEIQFPDREDDEWERLDEVEMGG
jgi:type VI secretion system secreted protein VgrG